MGIRDLPAGYDVPELVSDHGSQPTSTAFRGACEALGIHQIFASHGNPKGNADTERMMRTIKEDLIYSNDFQTFNELEYGAGNMDEALQRGVSAFHPGL